MSKAFTKDSDDDGALVVPPRAALPEGVPNYVTREGLRALRHEHGELVQEKARAEALADDDPDRTRLVSVLGARLTALEDRIASAEVVAPSTDRSRVRFGATVSVEDAAGSVRTYRIVGVDEADVERGVLAFVAPLARALLGHEAGDEVEVRTPRGRETLTILDVTYQGDERR